MEFILTFLVILLFTKMAGDVSVRIGQPAVLGKLIAGIVLGPALLGVVQSNDFIHYFSEIGVLLLMFIAGLETNLEQLRRQWKPAFAVAVGGIILPFIAGSAVAGMFGWGLNYTLFMGVLFSATSVSISVQVLKEMNRLDSREGTTILGAAVVDDVLVVILLAVMMSFLGAGEQTALGLVVGKKLIFIAVIVVVGGLVVPRLMKSLSRLKVSEPIISIALIICFGFAYFADLMGMAGIIGSFAAGLAVSRTEFRTTVEKKIEPIAYAVFVPVFFVSIGLNVSFEGILDQLGFMVILTVAAVISKLLGGALGAKVTGFSNQKAFAVGAGMVSRGEVALIIAAMGLQSGLLLPEYFTSVIMMIIITTLVAPPLLKIFFVDKINRNTSLKQ
ncbi:cation:proton antiporter [Paenibacillus massiliensis]|uniref:cation:proton antiporter n=1 Tax=Paenibacillus massiliensis TaxID=225917 RepID=UPI000419A648|nr:cation:proton antiporter [Paenibacillus massiliensis]